MKQTARLTALLLALCLLALPALAQEDKTLDLTGQTFQTAAEVSALLGSGAEQVNLTGCGLPLSEMAALCAAWPSVRFIWSIHFNGITVSTDDTSIDLGKTAVKNLDEITALLTCFPNLRELDMYATVIKKSQRDYLEKWTAMWPDMSFGWTMVMGDHKIRTDATAFSTLHNNKSPQHDSGDFAVLKYCKSLLALDIGHNKVKDISFLADLPSLKILIVACNKIEDISVLSQLTQLEYLEIFNNRKIADLTPLAGLTHLLDLNICFNQITDLTPLYGLTSLERLWLYHNTALTDQQIDDARAHLPGCEVNSRSYSTLGGWREHPRYDVLHRIFASGVYEPWTAE